MSPKMNLSQSIIVDRALEIAERIGIEQVTMANIARELNIKPPSLYNHVSGLDEIKQKMAEKAQHILFLQLKEAVIDEEEGAQKIKAFSYAYYRFAIARPGMYEASIVALDSSSHDKFPADNNIVLLIKDSLAQYNLSESDSIHIIRGLRSLLHGLVDINRKGGFKLKVDMNDTLEKVIDTFLLGLSQY